MTTGEPELAVGNEQVQDFAAVVQGRRLEVRRITAQGMTASDHERPELVFLHEGLGSVSHWKDFPQRVVAATGCPVTVYARYGSGQSDLLEEVRSVRYMHEEGMQVLPELLDQLKIKNPVLVGHSDGGSIALIYAGT